MRVAIYASVSTYNRGQDPANQLEPMREWARAAGHTIACEYVEHQSGKKSAGEREQLGLLLTHAHQRRFDLVCFWALDRLTREGMVAAAQYLQRLTASGVGFRSHTEPHLNAEDPLVRDIVLAIVASLAKAEVEKLSSRTKAGMERARARGKRIGRPPASKAMVEAIQAHLAQGLRPYRVAKLVGCDPATVRKYAAVFP